MQKDNGFVSIRFITIIVLVLLISSILIFSYKNNISLLKKLNSNRIFIQNRDNFLKQFLNIDDLTYEKERKSLSNNSSLTIVTEDLEVEISSSVFSKSLIKYSFKIKDINFSFEDELEAIIENYKE